MNFFGLENGRFHVDSAQGNVNQEWVGNQFPEYPDAADGWIPFTEFARLATGSPEQIGDMIAGGTTIRMYVEQKGGLKKRQANRL